VLEVRNLTKVFTAGGLLKRREKIVAVKNLSFDVKKGQIISLVGESGSGKTTTARMILRLIPPTRGEIIFDGKNVWKLKGTDLKNYWREVHGIFQDTYASFNPLYKVDRMLYQVFNLFNEKPSKDERDKIVIKSLESVGLSAREVLGKYPHQLSGGERQRLMVARCFLLRPKLILADEPVSMVDASTRMGIIKLFMDLREKHGVSTIFITHDLGLAYYASDIILIMYKGEIVEQGTCDEILEHPQHPYTKRLIKDIPLLYKKWEDI